MHTRLVASTNLREAYQVGFVLLGRVQKVAPGPNAVEILEPSELARELSRSDAGDDSASNRQLIEQSSDRKHDTSAYCVLNRQSLSDFQVDRTLEAATSRFAVVARIGIVRLVVGVGREPWNSQRVALRCASANNKKTELGETNYAFCIGDLARDVHQPKSLRGMFGGQQSTELADVTDGTSCTIMFAEIGTASDQTLIANYAIDQPMAVLENPSKLFKSIDSSDEDSYDSNVSLGWPRRGGLLG